MKIIYNGVEIELNNCKTVADFVNQSASLPKLFVIEKNNNIIYKEDYHSELLDEGDSIELVTFTGGG